MLLYDIEFIKAVRAILVNDDLGDYNVRSYVAANSIIRAFSLDPQVNLPQITLDFKTGKNHGNLPAREGTLMVKVWYDSKATSADINCRRCGGRISFLLDSKPQIINDNNSSIVARMLDCSDEETLNSEQSDLIYTVLIFDTVFKYLV